MMPKYLLILFAIASQIVFAQTGTVSDSAWNLYDLPPLDSVVEPNQIFKESHGWFPMPVSKIKYWSFSYGLGGDFDVASGIRSKAFAETKFPFTGTNNLESDELKIKKASSKDYEKKRPGTGYLDFRLTNIQSTGTILLLLGDLSIGYIDGMLFSEDKTRHYLSASGAKVPFKEVAIVAIDEWFLNGSIGVELPIYGGFLDIKDDYLASYYSLTAKLYGLGVFWSDAVQYYQIADAKDQLRYQNNRDTVRSQSEVTLKELNRFRYGIELTLSWVSNTSGGGIFLGLDSKIPLSSVLRDADWKQYYLGVRLGFLFGMKKKP